MINLIKRKIKFLTLKRKLKELNKIETINRGGCAIVAYGIKKYLGKDAKIIYLLSIYDINSDKPQNISQHFPENASHVVVEMYGKYIDSKGIHSKKKLLKEWGAKKEIEVSFDFLKKSINEAFWNPCFDRAKYLETIDRIIGLKYFLLKNISLVLGEKHPSDLTPLSA